MKIKIYEITHIKHSGSRGSTGFTSACFVFAVKYMFISLAPLPHMQNMMEQGHLQPALPLAHHQGGQIVVTAREQD